MKKPKKNFSASESQKTFAKQPTQSWGSTFFTKQNLFIIVIVFISYGAALMNDYALDDFIVLVKNSYVQSGFAGIGKILGQDTFAGMTEGNIMVLAGGRYRPLSLVTFAIEHQLFGNSPFLSHCINLLLYAFSGIVLFRLLKRVLINNDSLSICITLLFMALPIHSEAIINIKARDDIMCFLFFLLSLDYLFIYQQSHKKSHIGWSYVFFFFSLLSKETAITFVAIIPLTLYFFTSQPFQKIGKSLFPYFLISLFFITLRYLATKNNSGTISNDLFNNPFMLMNTTQHYATVFLSWLIYLRLTFLPIHLSYDYNFNQIPATDFGDWRVMLSITIHVVMLAAALLLLKRKSFYSFGILFYFITFSILSNLFFSIGAPLAERFMYIPSLGICIVVVKLFFDASEILSRSVSEKTLSNIGYCLLGAVIVLSCYRNIVRCFDWKDNHTLFIADVKSVPQNSKANLNAGLSYTEMAKDLKSPVKEQMLDSAKKYLLKGIEIYPKFSDGYLNMGVIYSWLNNFDSAEVWWNRARSVNPNNNTLKEYDKVLATYYYQRGLKKGTEKNYDDCINDLLRAYKYDSFNADITYNLGGVYFTVNDLVNAKLFFEKTLQINPANQQAASGLQVVNQRMAKTPIGN
ncbi:MAG: glycosyltransferase family 39 protein [Bacteroidia bacterium]